MNMDAHVRAATLRPPARGVVAPGLKQTENTSVGVMPSDPQTSAAQAHVFRNEGEFWTIAYAGVMCHLRDSKGLQHLAYLLGRPGSEVAALELIVAGQTQRRWADRVAHGTEDQVQAAMGRASPAAYRARVDDLRAELERAQHVADAERAAVLQEEIAFLTRRQRSPQPAARGDAAERARVNVTRAIALAASKIAARNPALGEHFARTIKTGTRCRYAPDPRAPIDWVL